MPESGAVGTSQAREPLRQTWTEGDAAREDANVCYKCVDDSFLRSELQAAGKSDTCHYCHEARECVTLQHLSERIHDVLKTHFRLTPSEPIDVYERVLANEGRWERSGDEVEDVIAEIAGLSQEIAAAVREYLSEQYDDYEAALQGEGEPYDDLACYAPQEPNDSSFRESWTAFRRDIQSRARFFNQYAKEALDHIFADISTLRDWQGTPAIRELAPTESLYRVRTARDDQELQDILKDPARGIGPPPSRNARAGRMNASGIAVFYGALDEETCIAESRAPVGSYVFVGQFTVVRPLKLLDFGVLTNIYVDGSHFDPDYQTRCGRARFLQRLVDELSRPVMPHVEEFQYLPTQVVAEYLATYVEPRLDGIVFSSSQTANDGQNIVLFNHACGVEPYELPEGTRIDFNMGWESEDDYDDSIAVTETVPAARESRPSSRGETAQLGEEALDEPPGLHGSALRLDIEGVRVLSIRSVSYGYRERVVSRYRQTEKRNEDVWQMTDDGLL